MPIDAIDIEILGCNTSTVEIGGICSAVISGGAFHPGDFVFRSEFIATSGALQNAINNISGVATGSLTGNFYPLYDNPAGYITSAGSTGSLTGNFYPLLSNPSGYLINLDLSGASGVLQNQINNFSSISTGSLTGEFISRNESGQFYSIQNNNNYSTSGNLYQTGANLFVNDTVLSGKMLSLSGDLLKTGQNLLNASGYLKSLIPVGPFVNTLNGLNGIIDIAGAGNNVVSLPGGGVITISGMNPWLFTGISITGAAGNNNNIFNVRNSSGDIYIVTDGSGHVGIGGFSDRQYFERALFSIVGNDAGQGISRIQNLNLSGYSSLDFLECSTGNVMLSLGYANTGVANPNYYGGIAYINSNRGNPLGVFVGGVEMARFKSGYLGLYNKNPIYNLDVSGSGNFSNGLYWKNIPVLTGLDSNTGNLLGRWESGRFYSIDDISGLQNQIINTSKISVTGSSAISGLINLTGAGGLQVSLSGNNIVVFSGGAAGGIINNNYYLASGITGISITGSAAFTGHTNIVGFGNISVGLSGSTTITISGSQSASSDTASNLGNGSGWFSTKSAGDFKFKSITVENGLYITGDSNRLNIKITGDYTLNSQTGNLYPIYNPNNYATSGNLFTTGANLFVNDTIISGKIISLSGDLGVTGINLLGRLQLLSGNVVATGITLLNQTVSLSGDLITSGRNLDNKIGVLSGQVTFSSQTGGLYPIYNPSNYSTSGNLYQTGANLFTNDTVLSGKLLSLSGDLLSTGLNLFAKIDLLSGNVVSTGINLLNRISSLSGDFNASGTKFIILSGNLVSTGITLLNQIASLSGDVQSTGLNLLNRIILLSGNLISTGQTLLNSDIIISGNLTNTGVNLEAQIRAIRPSGITGISITGGASCTGFFNLNPGSNISFTQLGLTGVTISSTAAGSIQLASGITGISVTGGAAITGLFNLNPGSNVTLTQVGNTGITISATTSISTDWNLLGYDTTIIPNNSYIVTGTTGVNLLLPLTLGLGNPFDIVSTSTGGWKINQNSGQIIRFGNTLTTTGTSGYIQSTSIGDCVQIICNNINSGFSIIHSIGNIIVN